MGVFYENFEGATRNYFDSLKHYKPLSRKEERKLLTKYKKESDINARNKLINSNLRYAVQLASSFRGHGLSYLELISEANKGLIDSIDKFDIHQDVKLISYSKWWIMQRMQAAIDKKNKVCEVELPRDDSNDYEPEDDIVVAKENKFDTAVVIDEDEKQSENEITDFIEKMYENLDDRETDMIDMYYGRTYDKSFTLEEIGNKYGLTKERARQVIQKAFRKIRSSVILDDNYYITVKK
jgi:RNA polymerase primary sigma factor